MSKALIIFSKYRALLPFILAQAKHETGNFKSGVYKANNNLFGMKHPYKRPSVGERGTLAPDGGHYQKYSGDSESVNDLLLWMEYTKFPTTVKDAEQYALELKGRSYYGDTIENYTKGLKFWMK